MKLRIRHKTKTALLEVENDATFGHLLSTVKSSFQLECDVRLSLNNKMPIDGTADQTLQDLDIVSGDLLYILADTAMAAPSARNPSPAASRNAAAMFSVVLSQSGSDVHCVDMATSSSSNICQADCDGTVLVLSSSELMQVITHPGTTSTANTTTPANSTTAAKQIADTAVPYCSSEMSIDDGGKDDDTPVDIFQVNCYLNEPMVVRDATAVCLPQSLVCAVSLVQPCSRDAALVTVLHVLMSELGYQLQSPQSGTAVDWHMKAGSLCLDYAYQQLPGVEFQLLCVPMHSVLVVHGLVRLSGNVSERYKLQLGVSTYVNNITDSGDAVAMYNAANLSQLSRLFKDTVAYRLLQAAFTATGAEVVLPTLDKIFYELQIHILKFVDVRSLLRLSVVCQQLYDVARQPVLWRRLYVRQFGSLSDMSLAQDWLEKYKTRHIEHQKLRQQKREMLSRLHVAAPPFYGSPIPPGASPFNPFNPFPAPGPGFIIGGEYDLRPTIIQDPFYASDPLQQPYQLGVSSNPLGTLQGPGMPHPLGPDSLLDDRLFPSVLPAGPGRASHLGLGRHPLLQHSQPSCSMRFF